MRRKAAAKVASAAVTRTQLAVEDELGWLFRAQPTEDYGIDAHAEVVDGEDVRGRLLALQIKGGVSWFGEPCPGGWWFRPADKHVQYWTNHSLPVVVVLYHPETVAFNPQDGILASGTDKGIVRLRNCATGRQVGVIDTKAQVASTTFSPDGKTLAIGGGTDSVPSSGQRQSLGLCQGVGHGQQPFLRLLRLHPGLFGGAQP